MISSSQSPRRPQPHSRSQLELSPARRGSRALLAGLIIALLSASAAAQGYYPAGAGLSWTYSSGETQAISGPRGFQGHEVWVLTHYLEGVPISEDYLEYGEGGVISHGSAAGGEVFVYSPPLLVYPPAPLEAGMTWTSTTALPGFNLTLDSSVVGVRGVATSVGRFNALLIRQTSLTSNGGQTVLDLYLVPGVGVVRFETQDGTIIDLIDKSF